MATYPLNIALIVEDCYLPAWQVAMLRRVAALANVRISLVLLKDQNKLGLLKQAKFNFFKSLRYLEANLLKDYHPADRKENISGLFDCLFINLKSKLVKSEYINKNINLVINLSSNSQVPNYLIEGSNYGVWHYFYNSHLDHSAQWAGVQEFSLGQDGILSGVLVDSSYYQQSRYLWLSYTSKQCLLSKTHDSLLWKMEEFIPALCRQAGEFVDGKKFIQDRHLKTLVDKVIYLDSRCYCVIFTENFLVLLVGFLVNHIKRLINKIILNKQWVLLKKDNELSDECFTKNYNAEIIKVTNHGFVADPCLVEENGEQYLFFEEYVEKNKRGRIVCSKLSNIKEYQDPLVILERDYHLSYPFVFKSEDIWYLIPESAENKTVDLYRCQKFPDEWVYVKSLLTGVEAYDATLHYYAKRWWIFVNLRHHSSASPNELLYLFSAESLLADHWQAHPANPIISHADKARSAGALFEKNAVIYRPSQNCAGSYGRGLNLNQVIEWNEHSYKEKTIAQCIPNGKASLSGMHTITRVGNTIITDGIYTRKRWQKYEK